MSAAAMRSPAPGATASPVYTPAVLQGEPPPWAHPTPSPSAMMRCPDLQGMGGGASGPTSPPESPLVPPELLWGVCMPFIQEMLQALQQAMQREVAARLARTGKGEAEKKGHGAATSPVLPEKAGVSPFQSLFNPTPRGGDVVSGHRARRTAPADEPLHEETGNLSEHEHEAASSAGTTSPDMELRLRGDDTTKGRVTLVPSSAPSIGSSSKGTSPMLDDHDPQLGPKARVGTPGTGGSLVSSPVPQGLDPSRQAMLGAENAGPLYLKWEEQHADQGRRDQQRTASSNASGTAPQLIMVDPTMHQPEGSAADGGSQMDGDSTPDAERSVMVCRHWKSKGWCRMEDKCKFLHPEHKRGASMKKGGGRGSTSGAAAGAVATACSAKGTGSASNGAAGEVGGKSNAKSRRAGKSRRGTRGGGGGAEASGDGAPAAMAIAPGLVQSRPVGTAQMS
mmetsp:Transcript_56242/g.164334  ORF Transcript_56242/g.164334 Transcript_56242/m.164334 type:complete len:451 (-) Transcript_56242:254-1606(-)